MRVLELFCGIGGCAAALPATATVALAIDQSQPALAVYQQNFAHPTRPLNLQHVAPATLARVGADLWWMSPPCQPYTVRGAQRDLDDPRARVFLTVLDAFTAVSPPMLALENVPSFAGSRAHARLREALAHYQVAEGVLCPTDLGIPMRRRRFYLVASKGALGPWPAGGAELQPLSRWLGPDTPDLEVSPDFVAQYQRALHIVDATDPHAITACFTAAYGHSIVRSGSYLRRDGRVRRFAPAEIARLLGFPDPLRLPASARDAWALLGNSVSVDVVREVIKVLSV